MIATPQIAALQQTWRTAVGSAPRHVTEVLVILLLSLAALLARYGTVLARSGATVLGAAALAMLVAYRWQEWRAWSSPRRTIRRILGATDPVLGARVLRTLAVVEAGTQRCLNTSPELANWQLERLLRLASETAVVKAGHRRAVRLRWLWLALVVGIAATLAPGPVKIVEGYDVLLARHGRAPLDMLWLDELRITAQPPAYMRSPGRALMSGDEPELPVGSVMVFSGVPVRAGRQVVLTDGKTETPFISNGRGALQAHYIVRERVELRVAARFGDVLIWQRDSLPLVALADACPRVTLTGAPRTTTLNPNSRLELVYEATDDHGLKQLDVVLRSGEREDRRLLAHLDGESTRERGGHVLSGQDSFLKQSSLPVTVAIVAKDNDAVAGPKWAESAPITVVPPMVGEPEAQRYVALLSARDALVDLLSRELDPVHPHGEAPGGTGAAAQVLHDSIERAHSGLPLSSGISAFLRGQVEVLESEARAGREPEAETERALLGFEVVIHALSQHDAQDVARRLSEVSEEVAQGAKVARETERRDAGLERMHAALSVLTPGARQLVQIGGLGADLGGVALASIARIEKSVSQQDLWHAELAARHLAARLRRPSPSFIAAWRGGVEAGGGVGIDAQGYSAANRSFDQLMQELEKLVMEHGASVATLQGTLREAERASLDDKSRTEAKERAEGLRALAARLPRAVEESSTARGAAGIIRLQLEAIADELEGLALQRGLEDSRAAQASLEEQKARLGELDLGDDPQLWNEVRTRLEREAAWIRERLAELRRRSDARIRSSLEESGERERQFERRTGDLAGRGKSCEARLPSETLRQLERAQAFMQDAARELAAGRGERGLQLSQFAQAPLDNLFTNWTSDEANGPGQGTQTGQNGPPAAGGRVPEATQDAAEQFRRRVLDGLVHAGSSRLSPAIKRYAEGLVR